MSIEARAGESLTHTEVFSSGCVKTRLDRLYKLFIAKWQHEERQKIVDKAKRSFKPIPQDTSHFTQLEEKFGDKARKKAFEVLEQERQNYVDWKSDYIIKTLKLIIPHLKFLVYVPDEEGKPRKAKIYIQKMTKSDGRGQARICDVCYLESFPQGIERLAQIGPLRNKLRDFKEYVPYMSNDTFELYCEAQDLAILEMVRVEPEKETPKNAD